MEKKSSFKSKNISLKHKTNFFDDFKTKLVEIALDYARKNIGNSKKEIATYIENKIRKNIEIKVKKEIKKFTFLLSGVILLAIGALILLYGLFDIFILSLGLEQYLTNIFYGLFLFIIGLTLFLIYN